MNALYDLFVWREGGGGIRHIFAHGLSWGTEIPIEFADRCMAIGLALCLNYLPSNTIPSKLK